VQLTKFTHSCVRLESEGRRLLVDPGVWCESEAFQDVDDILITHEHQDHLDVDRLVQLADSRPDLVVRAPGSVTALLGELSAAAITVAVGDRFEAAGMTVRVVGGVHAEVYGGLPACPNVGYLIEDSVYHPGDALHVPDVAVETLFVPASAPWLKLAEAIDFVRAVAPTRTYPIHDALLSKKGATITDRWFTTESGTEYLRLEPGTQVDL